MADPLYQAPSSDGKPPGPTPQLFPGNDAYNSQHTPGSQQHNGFPTTQSEGPIMQNNTPPGQSAPSQLAAAAATQAHPTNSHPPAATLQVQDTTTVHTQPSDTSFLPSATTYSDEKREVIMAMTRGHSAATNAAVASNNNNNNNIAASILPQVRPGGAPARVYLNEKVVPYLLDGMKALAKDQPQDPLRALGEYLLQKSKEACENSDNQMTG